jgi:nucleotide-binding universal stress UspA family protein
MKILLATDGSSFSINAIAKCRELISQAKDPSVMVLAVHEIQVPIAAEPFGISGEYYQQMNDIAKERAEAAANEAVGIIRQGYPESSIDISSRVELGRPAEVIIDLAKDWNADLVIVGSHGRGFWGRLTLGSVSDAVVHHSPCSVLVVRGPQDG